MAIWQCADRLLLCFCRERLQEAEAWDARAATLLDPLTAADSAEERATPEAGGEAAAADHRQPDGSSKDGEGEAAEQPAASNTDAGTADGVADMDTEPGFPDEPVSQHQHQHQQPQQRPDPIPLEQLEV